MECLKSGHERSARECQSFKFHGTQCILRVPVAILRRTEKIIKQRTQFYDLFTSIYAYYFDAENILCRYLSTYRICHNKNSYNVNSCIYEKLIHPMANVYLDGP